MDISEWGRQQDTGGKLKVILKGGGKINQGKKKKRNLKIKQETLQINIQKH